MLSPPSALGQRVDVRAATPDGKEDVVVRLVQEQPPAEEAPSLYWIGVQLSGPLPEVVKQQLGLEQGLIVGEVVKDSPAEKAGLKSSDILVKADDTMLREPADLMKAVSAADGRELTLTVVRAGKDLTLQVKPEKRPADLPGEKAKVERFNLREINPELRQELKRLEEVLEKLKKSTGEGGGLGFLLARPGVVLPRIELPKPAPLPEGMSITIRKSGGEPAKIHVQQGDKEWEVAEDKLDDLPPDVRPHVQQFLAHLSGGPLALRASKVIAPYATGPNAIPPVAPPPVPTQPATPLVPAAPRVTSRKVPSVESRLDEVMKALEDLRKDVNELRNRREDDSKR